MYRDTHFDFLSVSEKLNDRVTTKRLLEILKRQDINVVDVDESENSYGMWLWITVEYNDEYLKFYGMGFHYRRERWNNTVFNFYKGDKRFEEDLTPMNKKEVFLRIEKQNKIVMEQMKNQPPLTNEQKARNYLYNVIAEVSDEDFAGSMLGY